MSSEKKYLKDYKSPDFTIIDTRLEFFLSDDKTTVQSMINVRRNNNVSKNVPFVLDGIDLETKRIVINHRELSENEYSIKDNQLIVNCQETEFVFETEVEINPYSNLSMEGLYKSGNILCTQCEAQGFRKITWYPDRPDVMTRFVVRITGSKEKFPILLSNGNLVDFGDNNDGTHYVIWEDPFLKPSYLFALVAGDLSYQKDHFITQSGKYVELRVYVEEKDLDKCDHALYSMKKAMEWDEIKFGREYDLEMYMIVAVDSFNHGAMENKGLNIFNSKYVLARNDTATDSDYEGILGVIGHEYFHNWTGDRVTLRDWFHLSLKEGLTVFRDQEFTSDLLSRGVKRIEDARHMRTVQFAEDSGPMAHPVRPDSFIEINNFYTTTVYQKGAEVIRMERSLIGDKNFRKGMDLYFELYDGKAVIIEDFVKCMSEVSGFDFSQFMLWYSQAGTPQLNVEGEYDSIKKEYTINISQSCEPTPGQNEKHPFFIPFAMGLVSPGNGDIPLKLKGALIDSEPTTILLPVKKSMESFVFSDVPVEPIPSLLRGFSAPVKIEFPYTHEDLIYLLGEDSDSYVRWEAGQKLSTEIILNSLKNSTPDNVNLSVYPGYYDAIRKIISDENIDGSFKSLLLTIPSQGWIWEQVDKIDVDLIFAVRKKLIKSISLNLETEFNESLISNPIIDTPNNFDAGSSRRIRNIALSYLSHLEKDEYYDQIFNQFKTSNNMTNVLAALLILSNRDIPYRDEAFKLFYEKWNGEFLLVNKWLAIQAMSSLPGTIENVKSLMKHESFEMTNPNKLRALIGGFGANKINFHDASGQGYALLSDIIIKLNNINPIVASRLVTPLTRWKKHTENRISLMKAELNRILSTPELSNDLFEIVSKSLK